MKTQEDIKSLGERLDQLTQLVMNRLTPPSPSIQTHQQTPPIQAPEPLPHEPESPPRRITPHVRHQTPQRHHHEEEFSHTSDSSESSAVVRRRKRNDNDDRGLKIDLPNFDGNLDPNGLIDWLNEIERVFEFKGYSDEKKCKIAILKFKGYASLWWENVRKKREREGKARVRSWDKLKKVMKKRFLPDNYKQDLYLKLHHLKQGDKKVEDYIREFEDLMMRSDIPKEEEQTIAWFLGGLQKEIDHKVELQPYHSFRD